ncbi:MAG: ribonucleoside-diphosphate reductase subunit alpha [Flammeovirgaceae bacterium]|nr:ribonucleoside-diphosphate reductase subunit alpha [Flammeovirgaceae bacterium]|tara:strand:+ start:830 stop:3655 length:2826 start_codon:yes stop_codon:yes gene_type:complete
MAELKVVKRNGNVVDFDSERIKNAVSKAVRASELAVSDQVINEIIEEVFREIDQRFVEFHPNVENIQDIVEKHLMRRELFEVAKKYILYRAEREKTRREEKKKTIEKTILGKLTIKKADGGVTLLDMGKLKRTIERALNGYDKDCSVDLILKETVRNLFDGMSTEDVDRALVLSSICFIEKHYNYGKVAARLFFQRIYKEAMGESIKDSNFDEMYRATFVKNMKSLVSDGLLDERVLEFDLVRLSEELNPERDNLFDYMGVETLHDRYFVRSGNKRMELPQAFWMRVAIGLAFNERDKNEMAIKFYHVLSTMRFVNSTPTLFHSATPHPQLSSCYLTSVEDDLHHIFKCLDDNAQLSKWAGGLGNDWTNIRGTGSLVKTSGVDSQGVVPFLKIANDVTVAINRSGRRRGATCAYLETWHLDIEDFVDLRKNTGDERRRTHDMNTSNWIPDLFIKRVINDEPWTLFSPDEVNDLHHIYGREFEKRYIEYERMAGNGEIKKHKSVSAVKLWRKMLSMLFETGHPWITFKDPCNVRSPQDHVGVVHSSNLCTEITLNTSKDETAVCNLGSINLAKHLKEGGIDDEMLAETTKLGVRMLDNVIDICFYPTVEAQNSNMKHRPIGLGIMGLQDVLFSLKIPFESPASLEFTDKSMEFVSYYAILSSSELAREKEKYQSYEGSKWSRGIFPVDTLKMLEEERGMAIEVSKDEHLDWNGLREMVRENGMRNSNVMAIAPTATIANISGCYPCIEPIYKNIYVKSNISGEFTVVNKYLMKDLIEMNLWNDEMLEQLKSVDGNLELIANIPDDLKTLYKEAFDVDPIFALKLTATRGKWIDQSQSHNVFMKGVSGKALNEVYLSAWKFGLKTTYYLRSLAATQTEKTTVSNLAGSSKRSSPVLSVPVSASSASAPVENPKVDSDFVIADSGASEVKKVCSLYDPDCEACQ